MNSSIIESYVLSISPSNSGLSSSINSSISSTYTSQICESASGVVILSEFEQDDFAVLVLKEIIVSRLFLMELLSPLRDLAFSLS